MGMFDLVEFDAVCDKCGNTLSDFQSKDGPCFMTTLHPREVKRFYTTCSNCNTWHEWEVTATQIEITKLPTTDIITRKLK
jgi:uncharacterized protein (DUF983 family)